MDVSPFLKVKLLPGSMPLTIPLSWAPGGELSVTSMVSPMKLFDMLGSVSFIPPCQIGRALIPSYNGREAKRVEYIVTADTMFATKLYCRTDSDPADRLM
jgi:hypothetical protein